MGAPQKTSPSPIGHIGCSATPGRASLHIRDLVACALKIICEWFSKKIRNAPNDSLEPLPVSWEQAGEVLTRAVLGVLQNPQTGLTIQRMIQKILNLQKIWNTRMLHPWYQVFGGWRGSLQKVMMAEKAEMSSFIGLFWWSKMKASAAIQELSVKSA